MTKLLSLVSLMVFPLQALATSSECDSDSQILAGLDGTRLSNYSSVSEALKQVEDNGIIEVYGTVDESIEIVNRSHLTFVGKCGAAINNIKIIRSDNIIISNFHIESKKIDLPSVYILGGGAKNTSITLNNNTITGELAENIGVRVGAFNSYITIENNIFESLSGSAVQVENNVSSIKIIGNEFSHNQSTSIILGNSSESVVSNNKIENGHSNGIEIQNIGSAEIVRNVIEYNGGFGIKLEDSDHLVLIEQNLINRNRLGGIIFEMKSKYHANDNEIIFNQGYGISINEPPYEAAHLNRKGKNSRIAYNSNNYEITRNYISNNNGLVNNDSTRNLEKHQRYLDDQDVGNIFEFIQSAPELDENGDPIVISPKTIVVNTEEITIVGSTLNDNDYSKVQVDLLNISDLNNLPEGSAPFSDYIFDFEPSGETFEESLSIAIPIDVDKLLLEDPDLDLNNLKLYYLNEETNKWEIVGGVYIEDRGIFVARIKHFSTFALSGYIDSPIHVSGQTVTLDNIPSGYKWPSLLAASMRFDKVPDIQPGQRYYSDPLYHCKFGEEFCSEWALGYFETTGLEFDQSPFPIDLSERIEQLKAPLLLLEETRCLKELNDTGWFLPGVVKEFYKIVQVYEFCMFGAEREIAFMEEKLNKTISSQLIYEQTKKVMSITPTCRMSVRDEKNFLINSDSVEMKMDMKSDAYTDIIDVVGEAMYTDIATSIDLYRPQYFIPANAEFTTEKGFSREIRSDGGKDYYVAKADPLSSSYYSDHIVAGQVATPIDFHLTIPNIFTPDESSCGLAIRNESAFLGISELTMLSCPSGHTKLSNGLCVGPETSSLYKVLDVKFMTKIDTYKRDYRVARPSYLFDYRDIVEDINNGRIDYINESIVEGEEISCPTGYETVAGSYKTNDSGYRDFVETDLDYNGSWIELKGYRSRTVRTSFYCMKRGMIGGANGSTWVEGIVERQWRDNIGWLKYTKCKGGWDNNLYYKRIGKDVTEICQEKNVN